MSKVEVDLLAKIPCTLIPQGEIKLLVPNSAIQEVVKTDLLASDANDAPAIIGKIHWNDQDLKIFSSNAKYNKASLIDKSAIIVILKSPDTEQNMGFFASHSPKSTRANQRSLSDDNSPTYINTFALRYIYIEGTQAIIPDLSHCFSQLNQQVS